MRSEIFGKRYLFHFHTHLTDGELSVRDYFDYALASGTEVLIFLEHIRTQPTYNVEGFVEEIKRCAKMRGIPALVGFETKLLPDGNLDISEEHLKLASVIGVAEHGFPDDSELLDAALKKAFTTYPTKLPKTTFVWVHPGLWFRKRGIDPHENRNHRAMFRTAKDSRVLIERNIRYGLIGDNALGHVAPGSLIMGADAHNARDLQRWEKALESSHSRQ